MAKTTALAETAGDTFGADKMNVAALGNVVAQLHMHVIARRRDDAAWPRLFGASSRQHYTEGQVAAIGKSCGWYLPAIFVSRNDDGSGSV